MVVSDKYKYLFVELPRTGTTAISKELIENYDGREILDKHATYRKFLKIASDKQKTYKVFSCVRNPIDRTVSFYVKCSMGFYDYKFRDGYSKNFYDRFYLIPRVRFITKNHATFDQYLRKFNKWPYVDWSVLDHDKFDYIIRFENLNSDFKRVLNFLDINPIRDLPQQNITTNKKSFESYLSPESANLYLKIFGPALKKLNYAVPFTIGNNNISGFDLAKYQFIKSLKSIYWKR